MIPWSPRRTAFSLIELLVVVVIVAVLAGLLMPALGSVKAQAQQTRCAASQRQLALAMQVYAEDWSGAFPRAKTPSVGLQAWQLTEWLWYHGVAASLDLEPALWKEWSAQSRFKGTVVQGCPLWSSSRPGFGGYGNVGYAYSVYYDLPNTWVHTDFNVGGPSARDVFAQAVSQPARRFLLTDSGSFGIWFNLGWADTQRHSGRAVYTFFDGHVQALGATETTHFGVDNPAAATWNP